MDTRGNPMKQDSTPPPSASLEAFCSEKLAELEGKSLRRTLAETRREAPTGARRDGRDMVSFCCNDYLGLSHHPDARDAAVRAIEAYGAGSGASRLVTGNHPLYVQLEERLARIKGTEAACVFGSGYLANIGFIPALMGEGDLIVLDEISHACMRTGARLSRGTVRAFRHNDAAHCREILAEERKKHRRCMILTEGVFSMDGDLAPLPALSDAADEFDAWLMTDDAHGLGVLGGGRGSAAHWGPAARVPLQMGTLSKAVGAYGGYLCASRAVVDFIVNRARSLIYSTGLPPSVVAAADAALGVIETDRELTLKPVAKARLFTTLAGLPDAESPIVPLVVGDPGRALEASKALAEAGFLVTAIRPPTVPDGTARLRFTFSALHEDDDIRRLAALLKDMGP